MKTTMFHEFRELIPLLKFQKSIKSSEGKKIKYGNDSEQYYIIKTPTEIQSTTLTVYIHGGAFRFSSAAELNFVGDFHTANGFINVNLCYRKVPKHSYPCANEDAFIGLFHALEELERTNIKIENIVVTGSSAGAYLGAMLCYNKELQRKYNLQNYNFTAFCSLSGLINVNYESETTLYKKFVKDYFKGIEDSPSTYLNGFQTIDLLVVHSVRDPLVKYSEIHPTFLDYTGPKQLLEVEDKLHCKVCVAPFIYNDKEQEIYLNWLLKYK